MKKNKQLLGSGPVRTGTAALAITLIVSSVCYAEHDTHDPSVSLQSTLQQAVNATVGNEVQISASQDDTLNAPSETAKNPDKSASQKNAAESLPTSPDLQLEPFELFRHIDNATVADYYYASFDAAKVPVGRIDESRLPGDSIIAVSGEVTQHVYDLPENTPKARAYEFYANELRNASFEILFSCLGAEACGAGFGHYVNAGGPVVKLKTDYIGYAPYSAIAARRPAFSGETYVFIYSGKHDHHRLFQQIVTTNSANDAESGKDPFGALR